MAMVATVATTATPTSTGPKTLNSTALNSTALYALPNSSKATSKLDLFAMVPEPEGGVGLASDVVGSCMLAAASVSVMLLYWCKHLRGTECFPTVPSL
ncbi:unnamed protein product [Effrenium voratum]|uniref:Uncharacterized protein n=1 Tax=Effrenium voratum TaxID=2562239 RepID=A0AA36JLU1_9DINO|nr:unnamed protein product [Effrenium voratum]